MKSRATGRAAAALERLQRVLASMDRVAVAFSGGLDSSVLLAATVRAIPGRVTALTVVSPAYPSVDARFADQVVRALSVSWVRVQADMLQVPEVAANQRDRCYHCKRYLFGRLLAEADSRGLGTLVDATNASDLSEHRPGLKALEELGIRSPLVEADMDKPIAREAARLLGLPSPDRPATACLLTRIPYGVRPTRSILKRIDQAEDALRAMGFETVRIRHHGHVARIELAGDQMGLALQLRNEVNEVILSLGWDFASLDLAGYESGRFDKTGIGRGGGGSAE